MEVEPFVRYVVGGGLALVAGLWATTLFAVPSPPWVAGVTLAALGVAALAFGIYEELTA